MAEIRSITDGTRIFPPSEDFVRRANIAGIHALARLQDEAEADYAGFWGRRAKEELLWHLPFRRVLNETNAPFYRWFEDGLLNVSYNCLDRHLATQPDKTAIIFESDAGHVRRYSYRELHARVSRFANALKARGVRKGDRVIIYLPMSVEAVIAMQACARIGAIHSVVFGGFSARSIADRIEDADACCIVTADAGMRGGKPVPMKATVDEAIEALKPAARSRIHSVIVYNRAGHEVRMHGGRDYWWDELEMNASERCEPEWVDSEHPLFILYTSGSTGKPKGVQHSSAGYLLGSILSMRWVFDYKPEDVYWCTADVGWITGHSYVAYGPLAVGATQVIFEGIPTWPDAGRFWQMIERHRVTTFYTAPTAIRSLIKLGPELPERYDLGSLRLLGSVGEPINPEAWLWYHEKVGRGSCPIVDTWWQTETGSHMIAPLPGVEHLKPGSCTRPLPGIMAAIVDEHGVELPRGQTGILVIKRPFPSLARTLWRDPERFKNSYYPAELGGHFYLAGDSARLDNDGHFWILGRIDDVLNVSGHRLGTAEIESALVGNRMVAEAAVVGRPHEIKGEAVVAYVVLKQSIPEDPALLTALAAELGKWVAREISPIARPEEIRFAELLPKTRSGKIMRRLLRAIARGEPVTQDTSTLENPAIITQIAKRAPVSTSATAKQPEENSANSRKAA